MGEKRDIFVLNDCMEEEGKLTKLLSSEYIVKECQISEYTTSEFDREAVDLILLNTSKHLSDSMILLEKLLKKEGIKDTPVILLAEDDGNDTEVMALQLGAMDYLDKPFKKAVLLGRIQKAIKISDSKKKLQNKANKDTMTGLWNRNYIESCIGNYASNPENKGVFMLLDLDNFKSVNDTFGHAIGDRVLINVAEALRCELGAESIISRIGGDEFVVFFKEDLDAANVRVLADRILDCVEETLNDLLNNRVQVSVSIGITGCPNDGDDFKSLYAKADKALYHVKQNGKRGFHFFRDNHTYSIKYHPERNAIDIDGLKEYIKENTKATGAYTVRYDGFKRIYQFILRSIERTGQNVQILIFTAKADSLDEMNNDTMSEAIGQLELAIKNLLRKGDVVTKYSNSQIIVILMDANSINGEKVAERIEKYWQKKQKTSNISISYSIESVNKKAMIS